MNIIENDKTYITQTYHRYPLVIKSGNGSVLVDENGKDYIDLGSGIAVNTFGYNDLEWAKAVSNQAMLVQHTSNYYYTLPQNNLAKALCEKSGMSNVFFGNSGAEANECAIKCARKYSFDKYGKGRSTIITLNDSFHGRTITTLAATGQEVFHNYFFPFTEGFVHVPPNDIETLKSACNGSVCAVMLEVIQGESGINVLNNDYLKEVGKLCAENDILLIIDEVQTGNGRTGKYFAYMHFGINPDIVTTAKGLGGGLPIGAALFGEKTKDVLTYSTHGSTFGGNPVCTAGAFSIVSRIDEALEKDIIAKSEYIFNELKNCENVLSVSGLGLMIGIETTKPAADIVSKAMEKGVLVITAKHKVRLLPPLNIPWIQLKKAINILKEVIEE